MGWFSPVKGSYPSLAQVDKTLPLTSGVASVERGNIVALTSDANHKEGAWKIAGASDSILYVALTDSTDPTAGFAGDAFNPNPNTAKGEGAPCITAIDLAQDGEYETSVFDTTKTYAIGDKLGVGTGGNLTLWTEGTVVGYVTAVPRFRWVNNAIAVPDQKNGATDPRLAIRTGSRLSVLRFKTAI